MVQYAFALADIHGRMAEGARTWLHADMRLPISDPTEPA